ncbi:hypothetical protein, partial [Burkholderia sp. Tr-860]|uniref:hypothetical protein n=1 Tax=Burkholderia sp. Tr-860 TaxID=2608338 RepID=UPI00141F72B7
MGGYRHIVPARVGPGWTARSARETRPGGAAETLDLLLPLLEPRADHRWRERIGRWTDEWQGTLAKRAAAD